jgi:origin recognition complex subunit 2
MKRKKQSEKVDEGSINERNQKRVRPGNTTRSNTEKYDEGVESGTAPMQMRSSRSGEVADEDGLDSVDSQGEVEDESEDDELGDESADTASESQAEEDTTTPAKAGRGRKAQENGSTPKKGLHTKKLFSTPVKPNGTTGSEDTPRLERNANRSARRKSTRTLIERTVLGYTNDNEEDIAQHIYDSEEDKLAQEDEELQGETLETASAPETPSKRRLGRPKGAKNRQRSPTPPQDLPPHELYFFQNKGGRSQTSNNNLSSLALLDHEEYFSLLRKFRDPHAEDIDYLEDLHASSFTQWQFELSQDFNICLYGWGSKKSLLMKFADHIYKMQTDHFKNRIVVVNGYVPNLTIRDILNTVASAISEHGQKLGSQPAEMLENLFALLREDRGQDITLIVHSIDKAPLRRPANQTILSRLSSHPQIHLVTSADHPSFPLLWDSSLRSTYNFLFHDCTTFRSYDAEVDVVDEVHELLGRSGRRVGGKEGVSFVLKSLPENAKNLFRVLVGEQLITMDDSTGPGLEGPDGNDDDERRAGNSRQSEPGVEYRVLYQKAVEEFICSNEMNFRTLLKE